MARISAGSYAFALVVSQALWALPGVQSASAQVPGPCYSPPFSPLISPCVPHDTPAGSSASIADLAFFAWQEFIALNWVAMDPTTTGMRGRADTNADFLSIAPDSQGNFPLVVWQTYRHKNELFPADGNTDATFDSAQPTYTYSNPPTAGSVASPLTGQPSFHLFNNLDETSQIGLCNMYAQATSPTDPVNTGGIRVAYEAKVNRAVFDYVYQSGFTDPGSNKQYLTLQNALGVTQSNLAAYGGICSLPPNTTQQIVMLPCGDVNVPGDPGEGAIEIKAAWRELTLAEAGSGRFFTRKVIYYTGPKGKQTYNNAVWGLVALHIIHKTKSFPAFVFATWEQVDNYDDTATPPQNPNPENLAFVNTGTPLPNIPVKRAHAIHSQVAATNVSVHDSFKAGDPNTVWQYYELIGVQATPVNGPPAATAPADDFSYYYLANIMVETNQTLQNFFGAAPNGTVIPFQNVTLNGQAVQMGGCQGCHGFQAQYIGGDMSRIIAVGAPNAAQPESLDSSDATSIKTYQERSTAVSLRQFRPQQGPWGKDRSDFYDNHRDDRRAPSNR